MATIGNRQNLTAVEVANAVEVYNSAGRLDPGKTKAANDDVFHPRNDTPTKQKAVRDKFYSDNR